MHMKTHAKYQKFDIYDLYAGILIACATGLRVLLVALGWPPTNADEGTMGLMALHIAYHGEHPLLFYGQNYMGSIEAYLGAFFMHLFGPTLFALRLSVILLTMLFLISTYLLSRLLFSKQLGLLTLACLSIGSIYVLTRQTIATGGTTQTLLFGSLAFLLASWLALTRRRPTSLWTKVRRCCIYACWGLVLGLGVWSDMIVLPFFVCAGLFLLLWNWREILWTWPLIIGGFLLGVYPLILYNQQQTRHTADNSLITLLKLFQGSTTAAPHTLAGIVHGIQATILVSVPMATGSPFCPVMELPWLGDNSPHTLTCTLLHASSGLGYLSLLVVAALSSIVLIWRVRPRRGEIYQYDTLVCAVARLSLAAAALLAIAAYAISSAPMSWPGFHARYLSSLLIATPAVLAPLWTAASQRRSAGTFWHLPECYSSRVVLVLICIFLMIGTGILVSEVPATRATNQQMTDLIDRLESMGITHLYTDYWSCDNIAFLSNEHLICSVVDDNLQPSHNRVPHYQNIVSNDSCSAYVFPTTASQLYTVRERVTLALSYYRHVVADGYTIYQPICTSAMVSYPSGKRP